MYNCYAGHGGEELGYVGVTTPTACAELCDRGDACKGFVYMYSQSKCWMRGEINLWQCEIGELGQESSDFSTFTKKSTCVQEGQVCGGPGLPDSACCDGMQCQRHSSALQICTVSASHRSRSHHQWSLTATRRTPCTIATLGTVRSRLALSHTRSRWRRAHKSVTRTELAMVSSS